MELKRLGKYEIVTKIGEGGMGEVYRAHDAVLGRDVALKTMVTTKMGGDSDEARQRFHREARAAAQLNHPNIITIHDFGEDQGCLYIAMELLEGADLREAVSGPVAADLSAKLSLMEQICDGLAFAHAKGIVHRDLKPGNILVQRNGQVKIMDFGLARIATSEMTRAGSILGTPQYMSPEQCRGEKVTAPSDVFSLGSVFYELVAGRKSFDSEALTGVLLKIMQTEPTPLDEIRPDLPHQLCRVIHRALAKDPARRYSDAGELREALREVRTALGLAPGPFPVSTSGHSPAVGPQTVPRPATRAATAQQLAQEQTRATPRGGGWQTLAGDAPTHVPEARRAGPVPVSRPPAHARSVSPPWLAMSMVVLVVFTGAIGLAAYWLVRPAPALVASPPIPASIAPTQAPATIPGPPPGLEAARRSLRDKDYRAAMAQADRILASDAGNLEARSVRGEAAGALRLAEPVLASLRRSLSAGDGPGASQALSRLLAQDPLNPELHALSERLNELLRDQAELARRRSEAARPVVTVPATQPPAATLPAPTPPPATPPPITVPAATPPPPTTLPVTSPAQSEAAARQAIRGVLDEYRAAFERRDADALRAVQPGVDYAAMKQVFATVTGYTVRLDVKEVTFEGDAGRARCVVTYSPVPKPAGKIQPVATVFHLRRTGDVWLIERLERK